MSLSRRSFLLGTTAAVATSVLPVSAATAPPLWGPETLNASPIKALRSFVVGIPGDYNWQYIRARTAEGAWEKWCYDNDYVEVDDDGQEAIPDMALDNVIAIPEFDGRERISNADWLTLRFETTCEKCETALCTQADATIDNGVLYCRDCTTKYLKKEPARADG